MATTAPSDPYKILGVDTSADSAAIKKAYRKLVLSCHPDKVTDESLKAQKQEEFHQIQQAYETIGDPDKRTKYDLELKAKKLREERDRAIPRTSTTQSRNINVNIYTASHPSEYRSSSTKHSPSKPASYKPYSAEFSKSCEHDIPNRSRAYQDEKKTRRTYSDERLDERKRREDDRERERMHRRKQEEEDERRRRQARREKEERELRERARVKEAAKRRERELRDQQEREDRIRAEIKAEKKAKERAAEAKRKQDLAEEKLRAKMRSQEHTSEEEDDRRSRAKKSSKKESPRDKTPSKYRERPSPRDEPVPELPTTTAEAVPFESKLAYAAHYIQGKQAKKSSKTSPKHTAEAPLFSDAYPDPEQWKPKRRVSGEKPPKAAAEAIINDATSPPISPAAQQAPPPRLHKSYTTMGHMPATADPRPSFSRSQTFDQEAFPRSMASERPRMSRQRTSIDEEDYYTPRVQKYTVRPDRTVYETSQHREPHVAAAAFPKIKTTQSYGPEVVSHSKRYDSADVTFADYYPTAHPTAQQQAYVATHS